MTFKTKWFSNKIVSNEGFSIRTIGRSAILYEDGSHRVYVSAEPLMTKGVSWVICPSDMSLDSEFGRNLADESLRELIVERIKAAFAFLDWRLDVT